MSFLAWNDELSIGDEAIDSQHKRMIRLIDSFLEAAKGEEKDAAVKQALKEVCDYTKIHFRDEEAFMEDIGFPQLDWHRQEHTKLQQQITDYALSYCLDAGVTAQDMKVFLKIWLTEHILKADMRIGDFIAQSS